MPDNDDGLIRPRHRKKGRASKRGTETPGRNLRVVPDPAEQDAAPLGHYPVDDLAAMSPSAVEMLVHRARLEAESMAASIPHVLITRDTETGAATTSEPFADGLHALVTAREFVEKYRDLQPRWDFTLTVAPVPG
ncbi:hypothetical protein [Nocardioides marmorisolisilvae]|uniref:Uncharacterized protein n=1 Tax=Nocardioides marmorisolisilvae TaxID=1542737 RepID=A0A3N0DT26_9ACTN|nr:hypothetical protein [Nocardioides marmorisolisilvae]RNL78740.1 hypothetical protein EFL95_06595 [Nocardioides marmorisolisilvae]